MSTRDPGFDDDVTPVETVRSHRKSVPPSVSGPLPDETPDWFRIARAEIGIHEVPGVRFSPRIMEYFKSTTIGTANQSDETAWCSAFACWCMERSGTASPHRANARSWTKWGFPLATPRVGAVTVFWRGTPASAQGHVGFYAGETPTTIWVLGGNQHNEVCFAQYPRMRLVEYRWPTRP